MNRKIGFLVCYVLLFGAKSGWGDLDLSGDLTQALKRFYIYYANSPARKPRNKTLSRSAVFLEGKSRSVFEADVKNTQVAALIWGSQEKTEEHFQLIDLLPISNLGKGTKDAFSWAFNFYRKGFSDINKNYDREWATLPLVGMRWRPDGEREESSHFLFLREYIDDIVANEDLLLLHWTCAEADGCGPKENRVPQNQLVRFGYVDVKSKQIISDEDMKDLPLVDSRGRWIQRLANGDIVDDPRR